MNTAHAPLPSASPKKLNFVIAALGVGAIASILDSTIVNVAVDHLASTFGTDVSSTQWVITAFLLAMAAVVPLSGWLIDRLGGRTAWMTSLAIFLTGSVLCGISWNLFSLIIFRALQGVGAGLILPVLMAVLTQAAGKERLMSAMGSFSLLVQVGPILGPVVGGLLIEASNWRWIFLVNVPFCLLGLALSPLALPRGRAAARNRSLDLVGLLLLTPALVALTFGLGNITATHGFAHLNVWGPLAGGSLLIAVFVAWSLHDGDRSLIDVRLYRDRSFAVANVLSIALGFTMFGGMLLIPLYFHNVLDASSLRAGLMLVPQGIGAAVIILGAKRALQSVSPRTRIIAGFLLMAIGTVPFALPALHSCTWVLLGTLVVRGAGVGLATPSLSALAVGSLPPDQIARGTTAFNIVQRVGAPFGTTVLAVVLAKHLPHAAPTALGIAGAFAAPFWWAIAATAIPVALACLLPRRTAERQPLTESEGTVPGRAAQSDAPLDKRH